jgi:hypothetical protein
MLTDEDGSTAPTLLDNGSKLSTQRFNTVRHDCAIRVAARFSASMAIRRRTRQHTLMTAVRSSVKEEETSEACIAINQLLYTGNTIDRKCGVIKTYVRHRRVHL